MTRRIRHEEATEAAQAPLADGAEDAGDAGDAELPAVVSGPVVGAGAIVLVEASALGLPGVPGDATHVLLIRRGHAPAKGTWSLPGGRVGRGERLVDAVAREVLEETGLAVDVHELVEVVELLSSEFHYVVMDYRATLKRQVVRPARPVAGDDADDARFVPIAELDAYAVTEAVARVVHKALAISAGAA